MAEPLLVKPEPKFTNNSNRILRPISSGYELKQDINPEIKRNLSSELNENKQQRLNIVVKTFIPKKKYIQIKNDYENISYKPQYKINMTSMNNINNINYYSQPYGNNLYQAKQYQYPNSFYPKNYGYNMSNMAEYNKNQYSQETPLSKTFEGQTEMVQCNKNEIRFKIKPISSFIPKSMREQNYKPSENAITNLNPDAPEYTPQNEALKKKEEEIKKLKEKEKKEKENIKNEENIEEQKSIKESEKEEDKKEEEKFKTNDEDINIPKKKSKLFQLLESIADEKKTKAKEKSKQIENNNSENIQTYKKKKKPKLIVDQKIE